MKKNQNNRLVLLYILASVLFLPSFVFAEDLGQICELEKIEAECDKISQTECRLLLEKCERYYREESEAVGENLDKTEEEKKTLENKVYTLNKRIKNLSYQINQSNLIVKDLGIQIGDTELSIGDTSLKIEDSKDKLANILRIIYEEDQKPIIEILFSEPEISDFFDNLVALELLNSKSKELLQDIKLLKRNLEGQKISLDEEKGDLEHMVEIQTIQKRENAETKEEQEYYLKLTETEYQKYLEEKKEIDEKAAEIRARIFKLIGVSEAPTFGEAYEIAKQVEGISGVRPAFILHVLYKASNILKKDGQS